MTDKKDKNANKKDIIVENLEDGLWFKDACVMAGIDESTGHRLKKADASFASRCEAGIILYKKKLINLVNLGSIKDGKIALEVLRTRWPKEWPKRIEITGGDGEPIKMEMPSLTEWLKEHVRYNAK